MSNSQQCKALKSHSTERCKNRTKRGEYCTVHQQRELGIKVAKSHIKDGGLGLYTSVPRKKDEVIADYKGVVTREAPLGDRKYVLEVEKHRFIDAENPLTSGFARFANDARPKDRPLKNNSHLSYSTKTKKATIKTDKKLPANTEVFIPYSRGYWATYNRKHNS